MTYATHNRPKIWALAALLALGWIPLASCGLLPVKYSAEPIDATVVDAETGEPLPGVVVVAHWVLEGGIHVDRVGELKILEAVTNKDGRFHFDGWGPVRHSGTSRLTYMDPELILFKSGYEYQRLFNEATPEALGGKAYPVRRSEWTGKSIKLKKYLGNTSAYAKSLSHLDILLDFAYNGRNCEWKHIPRMLWALDSQKEQFDTQKIYSSLSSIDSVSGQGNCGRARDALKGFRP